MCVCVDGRGQGKMEVGSFLFEIFCSFGAWLILHAHVQMTFGLKSTVKFLKFGTPQTIAIIVQKIEKFDVTLH